MFHTVKCMLAVDVDIKPQIAYIFDMFIFFSGCTDSGLSMKLSTK